MKYLILGSNGMAGHMIYLYLKNQGHDVTGFAKSNQYKFDNIIQGNALDSLFVERIVKTSDYDIIVNCIGILNNFAENNKSVATYLNAYFPHFLADITQGMKTRIFHISTDCVFSGQRGSYTEKDLRDGPTFYDRSKALGELEDSKNITLRNSIIGPDINPHGIGLLNWFMQQEGKVNGFIKSIWSGQTTLQLAKTIEKFSQINIAGLYNMVPSYSVSKFDLLVIINESFRKNELKIIPVDGVIADKSLVRTKLDFDYEIPEYNTMISELHEWVLQHKELYTHYQL